MFKGLRYLTFVFGGLLPHTKVIKDMILFIFFAFFRCCAFILCASVLSLCYSISCQACSYL